MSDSRQRMLVSVRATCNHVSTTLVFARSANSTFEVSSSLDRTEQLPAGAENLLDLLAELPGDDVGGEKDALACRKRGAADASARIDLNWQAWTTDGTTDLRGFSILATTDQYDHCVFSVNDELPENRQPAWLDVLDRMDYENPRHREMMDMEGLKKQEPGRTSGFVALAESLETIEA